MSLPAPAPIVPRHSLPLLLGTQLNVAGLLPQHTLVFTGQVAPPQFTHFALAAVRRGYAFVVQNERGRYFSQGDWQILGHPQTDGYDTLTWIAKQAWSNGKVGTLGCSSSAEWQLALAGTHHPALAALVPAGGALATVGVAEPGPPSGLAAEPHLIWQMVCERLTPAPANAAAFEIVTLSDADAGQMLALATLTKPGPFFARTHQLGAFVGVKDSAGRLLAMAG